jgi:pimeloyl-ACP methyl ester carboxylesterase
MVTRKKVRSMMTSYARQLSLAWLNRTGVEGRHVFTEEYVREWCSNYQSKFIEVGGVELHYRDEGQGPVLLMLHGFAGSLHNWNAWVEELKGQYRIVRLDLPGFGLSSPVRRKTQIEWFVEILKGFVDALGLSNFTLIGNSLGGWAAWEFTGLYPQFVDRLVLLAAAGFFQDSGKPSGIELMGKDQFRKLLRSGAPKLLIRALAKTSFGDKDKLPEDLVQRTYLMVNRSGMLASMIYVASSDARSNLDRLAKIQQRVLILWGTNDKVVPVAHADFFYSDLVNSELILYPSIGHVPMIEIPERSLQDLLTFLRS